MKLIIVQRSKMATYERLAEQFAEDRNVKVILERRLDPEREAANASATTREERRRLKKAFDGRDYIVIHVADEKKKR
jgi:hypothetical protein